eukprot:7175280-Ditylum_brightwellii.AAC.1
MGQGQEAAVDQTATPAQGKVQKVLGNIACTEERGEEEGLATQPEDEHQRQRTQPKEGEGKRQGALAGELETEEGDRPPAPEGTLGGKERVGGRQAREESAADRQLHQVYGDMVQGDDGTHLDGGVPEDKKWQA